MERLRELRNETSLNQEEFGKLFNLSQQAISSYESGSKQPPIDVLTQIADYFNVTIDYLLGRNERRKNPTYDSSQSSNTISEVREPEPTYINYSHKKNMIPVLGTIRAGIPVLAEDNWDEEIKVPEGMKADFALRVEGNSMMYVGIHPGDVALFLQSDNANNGQIVAAGVEDDLWKANLKFYIKQNGSSYLRSANPEYEDIEFTNRHRIIGVLSGLIKEPPSLMDYQEILKNKEYQDKQWTELIEHASANGLNPLQIKQLVEFHSFMAKQNRK